MEKNNDDWNEIVDHARKSGAYDDLLSPEEDLYDENDFLKAQANESASFLKKLFDKSRFKATFRPDKMKE